jgi:hypothetical protein
MGVSLAGLQGGTVHLRVMGGVTGPWSQGEGQSTQQGSCRLVLISLLFCPEPLQGEGQAWGGDALLPA